MVSLILERLRGRELGNSRWPWILAFPLVLTLLPIAILWTIDMGQFPDIFARIAAGMAVTGLLLIGVAGCVVIVLDLLGKIPLKRP